MEILVRDVRDPRIQDVVVTGVEVTSDGLSGTQIFFAPDSSGQSGGLTLSGVEESFDDTWTATTYTVEIIADANLTG